MRLRICTVCTVVDHYAFQRIYLYVLVAILLFMVSTESMSLFEWTANGVYLKDNMHVNHNLSYY
jgi:hypothetical protein